MKMMPYMNRKMLMPGKDRGDRGSNYVSEFIGLVIVVAIALAIIGGMNGTVASGITSASNTSAISGYSTWSSQTQSTFAGTGQNMALTWFLLPLLLLVGLAKGF